ncbi:alpha/beta hydrolase [Longimicrobium sp.]|uniref:alpha/beta fold hydrolase n=1 Tax=Longimicrobium sp. TaxID=2029185 RepID=UPI002CF81F8F|nr:alpha/beta hydrolase [Longimicrobium sp.]HSU16400.1 alpha/beta hydrolase [Longimicrobium sp.]
MQPRRPPAAPARPRRLSGPAWWVAPGYRAGWRDVGAYRIHCVEAGAGAETVVLLHGLSGSARWWQRNIPALAVARRVAVPDVIGFGRSRLRGPLPDVPALAAVLAEWIASISADPVHLVGHSMGGHLAIHVAARYPERVRRLVLVDAAGVPRARTPRNLLRLAFEAGPPRRWGDPRFLPVIWRDALVAGPVTVLRGLRHILRDDVRPLLPRISAPTLILWGEKDGLVPLEAARELRAGIAGSRLLVIPNAYHNVMVDRPDEFNAALLSFLDGGEVGE